MTNNEHSVSATAATKSPQDATINHPFDAEGENDEDYTSSSGSSSDSEHTDPPAPRVSATLNEELRSRLTNFLTGIERANRDLEDKEHARTQRIDDVDEHEDHYIEMNLGLGVLSTQNPDAVQLPSDKDESEASSNEEAHGEDIRDDPTKSRSSVKLISDDKRKHKPQIEEIGDGDR